MSNLDSLYQEYLHAKRTQEEEEEKLETCLKEEASLKEAQILLQKVAEKAQESAHRQVASLVSRCLQAVFGEDAYQFSINFTKKRGKTDAELTFSREGLILEDPIRQAGLGQVEVASFALRLACILLSKPRRRRLLVLDEPFKWVSKKYRKSVRILIESLAKEFEVQFILATHTPEFMVGKVIEIS